MVYCYRSVYPKWCNPIWEAAGSHHESEEAQIRSRIDGIVTQQLEAAFGQHSFAAAEEANDVSSRPKPRPVRRWLRRLVMLLRKDSKYVLGT